MKILIAFFTASLLAASYSTVHAVTAQQNKMKTCNEEANSKLLKGDERKDFMKSCLSAKAPAKSGAGTSQQEKMKTCNKEAAEKSLKGDERKKFMKSCLSAG